MEKEEEENIFEKQFAMIFLFINIFTLFYFIEKDLWYFKNIFNIEIYEILKACHFDHHENVFTQMIYNLISTKI